jgi:hypothetical protein
VSGCERQQSSASSTRSWFDLLTMTLSPRRVKGQVICAFVSLKAGVQNSPALMDELKGHVAKKIGAIARPTRSFRR